MSFVSYESQLPCLYSSCIYVSWCATVFISLVFLIMHNIYHFPPCLYYFHFYFPFIFFINYHFSYYENMYCSHQQNNWILSWIDNRSHYLCQTSQNDLYSLTTMFNSVYVFTLLVSSSVPFSYCIYFHFNILFTFRKTNISTFSNVQPS